MNMAPVRFGRDQGRRFLVRWWCAMRAGFPSLRGASWADIVIVPVWILSRVGMIGGFAWMLWEVRP